MLALRFIGVAIPEPDLQWAPLPQLLMELSGAGGKDGGETLSGPESDTFFIVVFLQEQSVPLLNESFTILTLFFHPSLPQSLPGEVHSYVVPGTAWAGGTGKGAMVGSIPFTHPAHVPALLEVLRHQCTINTLLASCGTATRRSPGERLAALVSVAPRSAES